MGVTLLIAALAPMEQAEALSCYNPTEEVITLELESVSEEGVTVDDTSAYAGMQVTLTTRNGDLIEFLVENEDRHYWREIYQ